MKGTCGHHVNGPFCEECGRRHAYVCKCGLWLWYMDKGNFCRQCGTPRRRPV